MLQFFIGVVISSLLISTAWSKCDERQTPFEADSSGMLVLGPEKSGSIFGTQVTINLPIFINGKQSCYHQKNTISINAEEVKQGEHVEFEITPLMVEFENVPSAQTFQYLNIEYDQDNKASRVSMMSFLCSGETPVGGDAFSDSLMNLAENGADVDQTVEIFIATGQAAENISVSQAKKAKAKVYDKFLEIYESRASEAEIEDLENNNIYVPNVISGMMLHNVSASERKLYASFFSRTSSSINGCSKAFQSKMADLLLESVENNKPFKGIELSKKIFSSKYKLKWMLSK